MSPIWLLIKMAVIFYYCVTCCDGFSDMPPPLPGTNTYQLRMPGAVPTVVSILGQIFKSLTIKYKSII
jgi:hypothetical protein